jgi:hypothetical protein
MNINGVWIGNWIYWNLTQLATTAVSNSSWIYTVYSLLCHALSLLNLLRLHQYPLATDSNDRHSLSSGFPVPKGLVPQQQKCSANQLSTLLLSLYVTHSRLNLSIPFKKAFSSHTELKWTHSELNWTSVQKVKVILRLTVSRLASPSVRSQSEPVTNFSFSLKFSLDSCRFLISWRPLWHR